jgi:uncharacterized short protein YbdD (DUF466 family)
MGWGWGVKDETFNFIEGMVIYQAILFYHYGSDGDTTKQNEIPLHSSMQVKPDCVKSVATDALTKGLSKLGFNADVFLGMFDNQKYVDNLKKKYASKPKNDDGSFNPPTQPKEQPKYNKDFVDKMEKNEPFLNGQRDKAMEQMNGGSNGKVDTTPTEEFREVMDAKIPFSGKNKGELVSKVAPKTLQWYVDNMDLDRWDGLEQCMMDWIEVSKQQKA